MTIRTLLAGAALLASLATAPQADAAATLAPGVYAGPGGTISASGDICSLLPLPTSFITSLIYPGPSQTGAALQLLYVHKGSLAAIGVTLPKTPKAGVTSWSGPFTVTVDGATISGNAAIAGTVADANALYGTVTLSFSEVFFSCSLEVGFAASRTGAN